MILNATYSKSLWLHKVGDTLSLKQFYHFKGLYETWFIVLRCFKKEKTQPKPAYVLEHSSWHPCDSVSCLFSLAYFRNADNPHLGVVEETVLALQSDQNQDLTFFAALEPKRECYRPRHAARTELTHL